MSEKDNEKVAEEIIALIHGDKGPFMEDDKKFFGRPYTDPSQKNAGMQTDCGGMIVTKAKMTYGEADALAAVVDLDNLHHFLLNFKPQNDAYFPDYTPNKMFYGKLWVAVYRYLVSKNLIAGDGHQISYSNSMEYLYNEICKRLVKEGYATFNNRYYAITEK